jgi:two-component system, NtrC family, sensor histidine kinase KinB
MTLQNRLWTGLLLLTLISGALIGLGTWLLFSLSHETRAVVKENYRSIAYVNRMQQALNALESGDTSAFSLARKAFERALVEQEGNVTEPGEGQLTADLRATYLARHYPTTRRILTELQAMNQDALVRKNDRALATADSAQKWMIIGITLFVLFLVSYLFNFPNTVLDPIRELRDRIQALADGDFSQRFPTVRKDELGSVQLAFNRMAAELEDWRASKVAQLRDEQSRLEAVLDTTADGLVMLDSERHIHRMNRTAAELLEMSPEAANRKSAAELALQNALLAQMLRAIDGDSQAPLAIIYQGKERYYQLQGQKMADTGWLIHLRDVTEFKELDLAKTNFLATISHELKTPLASINLTLKLMQDSRVGMLNAEQQKLLAELNADTDRLLRLVNQLLQIAQVETGQVQLELIPHTADFPLTLAVDALRIQAAARNVHLVIAPNKDAWEVRMDLEKTTWILTNLIGNAIRYAPEGSTIELTCVREANRTCYTVTDHGPGIAPEYQARLFERFYFIPNQPHGTGLGLSIARQFLEAQGGGISVHSEPGKGATFTAWLG